MRYDTQQRGKQYFPGMSLSITITSSPAYSIHREISPYYSPLPLRLGQTSPIFPLDENLFHSNP